MNSVALMFLLIDAAALLVLNRRWAALPLLVGACYIPAYLSLDLGPLHFTAIRVLVAVGLIRVAIKREWPIYGLNGLDRAMIAWAAWLFFSGLFHNDPMSTSVYRMGLIYDACGIYYLIRCFCRSMEDIFDFCQLTAFLLVPLAVEMINEKITVHNLFSILGGGDVPIIRNGKVRANGPFAHPILAGTVGAVCLPMMIGLWGLHRKSSVIGILTCFMITYSSASSGPILSAVAGLFALYMWRYRHLVPLLLRSIIPGYIALDLYMKDPAYFIIARIDLAGGSTSWYRCRLIQVAIEHLSEWWLIGTDYTRHWMWVVVNWSQDHTDITSHYIQMGVLGGLPLLLLFIFVLVKGFQGVTLALQNDRNNTISSRFMIWAMGASLFAHTATFVSVSYFDQTFVFLYLTLAAISSVVAVSISNQNPQLASPQFSGLTKKVSKTNGGGNVNITLSNDSRTKNKLYSRPKVR
jgi:hypothetical protein